MTTNFALSLSAEGIDLLHRVPRGWRLIGSADVDDPELGAALQQMREKALAIDPAGLRCKIVIPLDQIKYIAIDSTRTTQADIDAVLDGATPYRLDELVVDCERFGGRTHIAAVARETLQEAESFARAHGFNPVCFVAVPEPFTFQSEVFFGPTAMMPEVLGPNGTVDRDPLPVLVVGTRIKSRLLVFDTEAFADEDDDFDLASFVSGQLAATSGQADAVEAPQESAIAPESAPEQALDEQQAAVDAAIVTAIHLDRIVPEYHLPVPVVPEPIVVAAPIPAPALPQATSQVRVDAIIAEYHASLLPRPKPARLVAHAAPAPKVTAPKVDARPAPIATNRRPLVVGTAIAASLALAAVLVWSQTREIPAEAPSAIVAETTLPEPQVQVAEGMTDTAPAVPFQRTALLATPQVPVLQVTTPGIYGAPITAVPRALENSSLADMPLAEVDGPPEPPAPQIAATPGAPILRGRVLSPDEAAQAYAATGVWQRAPRFVAVPRTTTAAGIISPDPAPAPTRVAQPDPLAQDGNAPDSSFLTPAVPPAAGVTFPIDENGFILATPEGTLTPEGTIVFAGLPDLRVRARPELSQDDLDRKAALAPSPSGVVVIPGPPAVQPPLRPDDIVPSEISAGGVALSSLQGNASDLPTTAPAVRPRLRPSGITPPPSPADLPSNPDITSVIAGIADEPAAPFIDISPRGVGVSIRPEARPRNFARVVATARSRQQAAPTPPTTPAPPEAAPPDDQAPFEVTLPQTTAPVPGGVARAATQDDVIPLREMNLIGVYGRPSDRRALVRLSNGRYVRVGVGSTLDGGQVTAIGDSALNYVKRGRTYALELPKG